jgi:hypothetical protein
LFSQATTWASVAHGLFHGLLKLLFGVLVIFPGAHEHLDRPQSLREKKQVHDCCLVTLALGLLSLIGDWAMLAQQWGLHG